MLGTHPFSKRPESRGARCAVAPSPHANASLKRPLRGPGTGSAPRAYMSLPFKAESSRNSKLLTEIRKTKFEVGFTATVPMLNSKVTTPVPGWQAYGSHRLLFLIASFIV